MILFIFERSVFPDVTPRFVLRILRIYSQCFGFAEVFLPEALLLVKEPVLPDRADLDADTAWVAPALCQLLGHFQTGHLVITTYHLILFYSDGLLRTAEGAELALDTEIFFNHLIRRDHRCCEYGHETDAGSEFRCQENMARADGSETCIFGGHDMAEGRHRPVSQGLQTGVDIPPEKNEAWPIRLR